MSSPDSLAADLPPPKPAQPQGSIFQLCNNISQRLRCIPNFEPYLALAKEQLEADESYNPIMGIDPVSLLWKTFRQGSSLSAMYNVLDENDPVSVTPLDEIDAKRAKASVYHFLLKCKNNLDFKEDELFAITDLFKDDTNSFIKVLKTASLLLDRMESKRLIDTSGLDLDGATKVGPSDNRAKVVVEMLQTERKYIQDLEKLQNYMQECQTSKVISPETIRFLFANLHSLVDFQRRFLIGVECNALLPAEEQRFGGLFMTMEEAFSVYEPFCANYGHASDLAVKEAPHLMALSHIMEPNYELPSYLIKPIQRICKYPLLLRELIRYTKEEEYPHFAELNLGMEAINRVAGRVNEMRRKEENSNLCEDLKTRVVNWDSLNIDDFGDLLQNDKFIVVGKDQKEREMYIFLFEDILICCKELSANSKRAKQVPKKVNGLPLELRGRIPAKSLVKVADRNTDGETFLRVYWRAEDMQILILKCRNEEQIRLWKSPLDTLIQKNKAGMKVKDGAKTSSMDDTQLSKPLNAPLPAIPRTMQAELSTGSFRSRSASSPNIHAIRGSNGAWEMVNGNQHAYSGVAQANGGESSLRPMSTITRSTSQTKVKLNYMEDVFIIMVPSTIDYEELLEKVEKKLRICGGRKGGQPMDLSAGFRVRYRDEDNDFITINSDDDVQMAFESVRGVTPGGSVVSMCAISLFID
ncbi:Guanine nucleotide exchange factor for Cdc42p [Entomophthora muscae]|uniref:Guanine nucleotide exchange factor for Cdc42p n=1 Tax=Entomophthora muscae TaxID=34485 RepID=A0ACC2TQD0_9FUNG|nr:Guanine nucleotide exchange factor for Cdc42p [Entomophthora muscae]